MLKQQNIKAALQVSGLGQRLLAGSRLTAIKHSWCLPNTGGAQQVDG